LKTSAKLLEALKTTDFFFGQETETESITVGISEIVDCLEYLENIKVYESSCHEGDETFQDVDENEHFFLHSTATKKANDEKEEKRIASSNFPLAS
jgi:hypothetical protein